MCVRYVCECVRVRKRVRVLVRMRVHVCVCVYDYLGLSLCVLGSVCVLKQLGLCMNECAYKGR